jgi:hypothetical protein
MQLEKSASVCVFCMFVFCCVCVSVCQSWRIVGDGFFAALFL